MSWYIEYDHYPFADKRLKPERKSFELDCPADLNERNQAFTLAKKLLLRFPLANPFLVWKEEIQGKDAQ